MGAIVPVVAGLCTVKVGTGEGNALESAGYSRNGAEITKEAFMLDVPGDENGGDDGPPVDIQNLGEIIRVRLELTKYDRDVTIKIEPREKGGSAGVIATPGALMFAGEKFMRLLLSTPNNPVNFPWAIPREPIDVNLGTKFSTLLLEFVCYKDPTSANTGVIYNATTT